MERINKTITYCQARAKLKGHNIGPFQLMRLGPDTLVLFAVCQNDECWWFIVFDAYGPKGHYENGTEVNIIQPNFTDCIMKNCQAFIQKPTRSEINTFKTAEQATTDQFPGYELKWYKEVDKDFSLVHLIRDTIGPEIEYLRFYPLEQLPERLKRKEILENELLKTFLLV